MPSKNDLKLALLVDDSSTQCKVLSVLLKEEGYRVFTANDGARGVAMYIKYQPDLVLMDINMPIMNGFEAAREIKKHSQGTLAPLIFITSMDTDEAYIEAIDAGGDGILVRPFSPAVFKAKIKSIQRISDLYSQVKSLQQEQHHDAELAEKLMSDVIESRNFALDRIGIVKQPAALFSGDVQLSALCPNGDIYALLGDFTGHGLRSSIGAIPLAETFYAMTRKGFALQAVVKQVNRQLYHLLPNDLFLAAAFVCISQHDKSIYLLNAGLPDVYVISKEGEIVYKEASSHPPLGVLKELLPDTSVTVKSVGETEQVIMISDGIIEARDQKGDMYGTERFESFMRATIDQENLAQQLLSDVQSYCQEMPQEDDLSIIQIPCGGWQELHYFKHQLISNQVDACGAVSDENWSCSMSLSGEKLASVNPVPMLMNHIKDIEGNAEHWQCVYTILTELYVNALDHGVLGLTSDLKSSSEGFSEYFNEREARLSVLKDGFIDINMRHYKFENGGEIIIEIKDSGEGFESYDAIESVIQLSTEEQLKKLCGRGIELVKQMTNSLTYTDNGTRVEASFIWNMD